MSENLSAATADEPGGTEEDSSRAGVFLFGILHVLAYWILFKILHPGMSCGYACSHGLAMPLTIIVLFLDFLLLVVLVLVWLPGDNGGDSSA